MNEVSGLSEEEAPPGSVEVFLLETDQQMGLPTEELLGWVEPRETQRR